MSADTREKIYQILKERLKEGKGGISRDNIEEKVDVGERQVWNHLKKLRREGKIINYTKEGGNKKFYAHSDYDPSKKEEDNNPLEKQIEEAITDLRQLLLRDPKMERVAERAGKDPEDEIFRSVFYRIAKEKDWTEPGKELIQKKNQEVEEILRYAIALNIDSITESDIPKLDTVERDEVEKYLENNKEMIEELEAIPLNEEVKYERTFKEQESEDEAAVLQVELPKPISNVINKERFRFYTVIMPDEGVYSKSNLKETEK